MSDMEYRNLALAAQLQEGRARLDKAVMAIKTQTRCASMSYTYRDGRGEKQCVDIPIEPEDILPIIERYISAIDGDIARLTGAGAEAEEREPTTDDVQVIVTNLPELAERVEEYGARWPDTYTTLADIANRIKAAVIARREDGRIDEICEDDGINNAFQIQVCSDWPDKVYIIKASRYEERGGKISVSVYLDGAPIKL